MNRIKKLKKEILDLKLSRNTKTGIGIVLGGGAGALVGGLPGFAFGGLGGGIGADKYVTNAIKKKEKELQKLIKR